MSLPQLDFPTVDVSVPAMNPADLAAEIERLRHDVADLRMVQSEHQMDNMHAFDEGVSEGILMERAAIIAWLRAPGEYVDPACGRLADCIERGVHRKETT